MIFDLLLGSFFDANPNPLETTYQRKIDGREQEILDDINKIIEQESTYYRMDMKQMFQLLEVIRTHEVFSE